MNQKFTKFGCWLAVATLTFALAACDDSSSGPADEELPVQENPELSSDSGIPQSSAQPLSSGTELSSNSGSGPVNNCTDNEQGLVTNCVDPQSSASVEESSSSVAESSSGGQAETCRHITDEQDPAKKMAVRRGGIHHRTGLRKGTYLHVHRKSLDPSKRLQSRQGHVRFRQLQDVH